MFIRTSIAADTSNVYSNTLQQTATQCNTVQCTSTHCNKVQDTATHCNTLQHTATRCSTSENKRLHAPQLHTQAMGSAPHCNTLQHTATHSSTLCHTATHCTTLHHTATYCNTLQHNATQRNTVQHIRAQIIACTLIADTAMGVATHCNTLQHASTHCNTLHHTRTRSNTLENKYLHAPYLPYSSDAYCNTLQHTATHCNSLQLTATHQVTGNCFTIAHTYPPLPAPSSSFPPPPLSTLTPCLKRNTVGTPPEHWPANWFRRNRSGSSLRRFHRALQNTRITKHCNTLQHTATHCRVTLQRTTISSCVAKHSQYKTL